MLKLIDIQLFEKKFEKSDSWIGINIKNGIFNFLQASENSISLKTFIDSFAIYIGNNKDPQLESQYSHFLYRISF